MQATISFCLHWLGFAFWSMPDFLGNNWAGASFACLVVFLYECRIFFSSNEFKDTPTMRAQVNAAWVFLMGHWRRTLRYWMLILAAFFVGHAVDLVRKNTDSLDHSKIVLSKDNGQLSHTIEADASVLDRCQAVVRLRDSMLDDKQSLVDSFQKTLTLTQGTQTQQQAINATCTSNLLKMLPQVRESIKALPILLNARDNSTGRDLSFHALANHKNVEYTFIVLLTTNESQPRFHGLLNCAEPFDADFSPELTPQSKSNYLGASNILAKNLTPYTAELEIPLAGKEWSPSFPAYLVVHARFDELGPCTFDLQ
jgi:hypothetical protein